MMMKTIARVVAFAVLSALPAAAVNLPLRIPFQGKLIDPATNNPKNGTFSVVFALYDAPAAGNTLFTETQDVVVTNGVFAVQIGTVSLLSADMFSGASAYLGVKVGTDAEMTPRQPLSMSPYAFTAAQLVASGDMRVNAGTSYSTFTSAGNLLLQYGVVGTTAAFSGSLTASSGTFTATGASQFSLQTSSGVRVQLGTLKVEAASKGIDATGTGIAASTGVFSSSVTAKQFFGIGATTVAYKTADQSRNTTTVLANDSELSIPIGANEVYAIFGFIKSSSTSATPDFKMGFTVPAGGAFDIGYHANNGTLASANTYSLRDSGIAGPLIPIGANIINTILLTGTVVNGANAGFLTLQWAQNTSNGTNVTVTAGSFIAATRVR